MPDELKTPREPTFEERLAKQRQYDARFPMSLTELHALDREMFEWSDADQYADPSTVKKLLGEYFRLSYLAQIGIAALKARGSSE
jgi:hypothetical protein